VSSIDKISAFLLRIWSFARNCFSGSVPYVGHVNLVAADADRRVRT